MLEALRQQARTMFLISRPWCHDSMSAIHGVSAASHHLKVVRAINA
jgi:hypothetical protein